MHLAAESHVDRSITGPAAFIETNIVGTYTLLEAARAYWNGLDETRKAAFRFHHISTDEVYGDLIHPDEAALMRVCRFYRNHALCSQQPLFCLQGIERSSGAGLVPNLWAANPGDQLLEQLRTMATCGEADPADHQPCLGRQTYPYLWQKGPDPRLALCGRPCRSTPSSAEKGRVGETYNIGGHNEKRNLEVVQTICDLLDELVPKVGSYRDQVTHVSDRPGHDRRYAIDSSKMSAELDWLQQRGLRIRYSQNGAVVFG